MPHPLTILYTPLPQASMHELRLWRCAFDAALAPWLDARQLEHVRRFGQNVADSDVAGQEAPGQILIEAALSRLMARAQLITATALHGSLQNQIQMDSRGRPLLDGWRVAFSHSGRAAFCALAPAGQNADIGKNAPANGLNAPDIGLDAEALTSPPPHASAFAAHELAAPPALPQSAIDREALRRWTIKEALLKAGCPGALLSGSGSTVFGILRCPADAEPVVNRMMDLGLDARHVTMFRRALSSGPANSEGSKRHGYYRNQGAPQGQCEK